MHNFLATLDKTDIYIALVCVLATVWFVRLRSGWKPMSWDHFWQNIDKFLATVLFLLTMLVGVHMVHHNADASSLGWIQDINKQLLSAVLTLLAARAMGSRATANGTTPPPVTPPAPDTKPGDAPKVNP